MAFRHFLRTWEPVRIGGSRLGPLRFGGGMYAVVPLSVLVVQQLIPVLQKISRLMPAAQEDVASIVRHFPAASIAPLVPLLVEPRVKPKHLAQMTDDQAADVFLTSQRVNDWEYIFGAFKPQSGRTAIGIERLAVALGERFKMYPREWLLKPMAEFLAITEALEPEEPEGQPLDETDRALIRRAGFGVN
jgi:hypothetical protein